MKQAIIVRKDLKMSCGKIAGQVAHASLRAYRASNEMKKIDYFLNGEVKIVLKVQSEEELHEIYKKCIKSGLVCQAVADAGRTQVEPRTFTAIGIGPDEDNLIDEVVRDLKLL